ncbi:hypothetical protein Hanom_Chr07g00643111 [Helianthus anomalus]
MHSIDLGSIHKALNLTTDPLSEPFFLLKRSVQNDGIKDCLVETREELYSGYHESVPEGLRLQRYKVKQWRWRFNFRKAGIHPLIYNTLLIYLFF